MELVRLRPVVVYPDHLYTNLKNSRTEQKALQVSV